MGEPAKFGRRSRLTGENMRDEFASYAFLAVTVAGVALLCSGLLALAFA
jgi:hypothetical protein